MTWVHKFTDREKSQIHGMMGRGITATAIAAKIGRSQSGVYKYITEIRDPGPRTVPAYFCDGCERIVTLEPCVICRAKAAAAKTALNRIQSR